LFKLIQEVAIRMADSAMAFVAEPIVSKMARATVAPVVYSQPTAPTVALGSTRDADHRRAGVMPRSAVVAVACSAAVVNSYTKRARRTKRRSDKSVISLNAVAAKTDAPVVEKDEPASKPDGPRVAVIGAGWGGWGAAKALSENGCNVTLMDSLPDPTGATPFLTPTGKPFDVGQRGFWKDYPNINKMLADIGVDENEVFTECTESQFYSPDGLEATAPVFSNSGFPDLPSPIGQVFASFDLFKRLPVEDRLTIGGLLYAMIDYERDQATFEKYDRMTAHELFLRMGISERLVNDFLTPTLLVGLFKPPQELSAAVVMELLYFYALAHQTSFDVRWMKKGTVQTELIEPLASSLQASGVNVKGGCRASELILDGNKVTGVRYVEKGEEKVMENLDGVVLALGAKGMSALVRGSPKAARRCPELAKAASLPGIDVVACRIWLDQYVATDTPANVLSRFESLRGAGGTFFMLDQLQPDEEALWGGEKPQGSVLACDFYNAGAIIPLSDEDIVDLLMKELLPAAFPAFANAKVVDSYVLKAGGAVSWFAPGSFSSRPPLETSLDNLVCAGDWVRMGDREHGAKGLCQERALVSGFEAANALARNGNLGKSSQRQHPVIPVRDDEPQVIAGRDLNKKIMDALGPFASPWVR